MKVFCSYIAKITILFLIMGSAFPCYSKTYKDEYNILEEQFRYPKDTDQKNYTNIHLIRRDINVGLYESAEKRINWQKEKGQQTAFFIEEIAMFEILSNFKQGNLGAELEIEEKDYPYYTHWKNLINSRLKYLNNDYQGAYYQVLKVLTEFLGSKIKIYSEEEVLLASRSILADLDQFDFVDKIYRVKRAKNIRKGDRLNSDFQYFYNLFYSHSFFNNTGIFEYVDNLYLQEKDFIPIKAYRDYWYVKLVLAFRDPDTFYPLINALKKNNLNIEGTPKIPDYMFTIFESWFDIVKYNKIDKSKFDDLKAAREKLPRLDKFRLIADAIYLRALLTFNKIEDAILYIDVLYKKVIERSRFRKSISTSNYESVTLSDFVVNISLFRVIKFLKENNYEYEKLLFKIMTLKHYQLSNTEVDNKFSLNKYDNKINQKGIFSKFRLLNSLTKELIYRLNDEIFLRKDITSYKDEELPGDYSFLTSANKAIRKIERLGLWEKGNSSITLEGLTLKLEDVKNNLNKNEVFFTFNHYGNLMHQYCISKDYQYDSFKEVRGYFAAKDSILEAAKNPSIIYPKKDANYIFDQTFSLLKKCIKNKNQYLTILMDPEAIDIPMNALVVGDEYEYQWFADKYKYTILPSPNSFYSAINANSPQKDYLGIGDPILNQKKKRDLSLELDSLVVTRGGVDYASIKEMPSLPETYDEIINTEKLFDKTDLLLRKNATEKELRKKVLGDYKIIHFATHGITSKTFKNQNLPGLVLTPELDGSWFNDGYLSSSEILEFNLSSDLVILSACNTGINETGSITSGLGDLSEAFLISGAKNVLATQWNVPSVETQQLVEEIIKKYKIEPDDLASSFKKGIRAFRKENKFDIHPYYWASFLPIGRNKYFDDKTRISIKNIFREGDPEHMDAVVEAKLHNNYIYATGRSIRIKPSTKASSKDQRLLTSKLLRLNIHNDKIDEIDIKGFDSISLQNILNNQLILVMANVIAISDNPEDNSFEWSVGKFDLDSRELTVGERRIFTKDYNLKSLVPFHYIYSPHNDKHYLINAKGDNSNKNLLGHNNLMIYVLDETLKFESELIIPFKSAPDENIKVNIIPRIIDNQLHIYLQNTKDNKNRPVCTDYALVQTYIIDENNNYVIGDEYNRLRFGFSIGEENTKYLPVIKYKDMWDIHGQLPCEDSYLSLFNTKKKKFEDLNYLFPLEPGFVPFLIKNKKNYVLMYQNGVDYGIDFSQQDKYVYDKEMKYSYDGGQYYLDQTSLMILSDDFKIKNHLNIPSRSYTAFESVVSTDDGTLYLFGAKDNLMSIDKITGL